MTLDRGEDVARAEYIKALEAKRFQEASVAALIYAEYVGARSPEGAQVLATAAGALATLAHSETQIWLWENRMPGYMGVA